MLVHQRVPTRVMDLVMYGGYGFCYDTTLMIIYGSFYSHGGTPRTLDVFFGTYHEHLDDLGISLVQEPPI